MRKFTKASFPKYWKVLADNKLKDSILVSYFNKTFKQDLSNGLATDSKGWWFFNDKIHNPASDEKQYYLKYEQSAKEDALKFEEISFEEFEYYVLNEQFFKKTKESNKELIKLLKQIV